MLALYRHPGGPRAVLFLHGFMGAGADWAAVRAALDPGWTSFAVDLPGHGASVGMPERAYTMAGAAEALAATLDDAAVARCVVVGYSMGGRLALYFALHYPERCAGLVLESASPGLATEAERKARRALDARRAAALRTDFDAFLADWYRMPLFASLHRHAGLVESLTARRRKNDPDEVARALEGIGTGRQPSLWERLGTLRVSTLAMVGAADPKYVALAYAMAARSGRITPALVPDAGHTIHAEQPDRFLHHLQLFLESTPH